MGASTSALPPLLDVALVRSLAGDRFDQAKFDQIPKNEEGKVTAEDLRRLFQQEGGERNGAEKSGEFGLNSWRALVKRS